MPVDTSKPSRIYYQLEKIYENRLIDEINVEKIVIKDTNMTLEQFIEALESHCYMHIYISNKLGEDRADFTYELKFLIKLNPVQQIGDSFIITIPDYLSTRFNMRKLMNATLDVVFSSKHPFTNVNIIEKLTFYDRATRNMVMRSNNYELMQHVCNINDCSADTREQSCRVSSNMLAKGFFISGNIDNIKHLQFKIHNMVKFDYDRIMLESCTYRISDNLCYIPFNGVNNYNSLTMESAVGSINFANCDNALLNFTFYEPTNQTYEIYNISMQMLIYIENTAICTFADWRGQLYYI
jgi:hypothetical protein